MNKRPLMILGNGPTMKKGLEIVNGNQGMECWGCNYQISNRLTLLFQMHGDTMIRGRRDGNGLTFLENYKMFPPKVPVMMQHPWKEIPTSVQFPFRQYCDLFPWQRVIFDDPDNIADDLGYMNGKELEAYHSCSMSYMVAFAVMCQAYNPIYIYGVDFFDMLRHETVFEKPCVESHISYALGLQKDLEFHLPSHCRLFTTSDNFRQVYGLEYNPPLKAVELEKIDWGI
jgi:hypothetical protein